MCRNSVLAGCLVQGACRLTGRVCAPTASETARQPRQQRPPSSGACSSSETSTSEQPSQPSRCESLQFVTSSVSGRMVPAAKASLKDAFFCDRAVNCKRRQWKLLHADTSARAGMLR